MTWVLLALALAMPQETVEPECQAQTVGLAEPAADQWCDTGMLEVAYIEYNEEKDSLVMNFTLNLAGFVAWVQGADENILKDFTGRFSKLAATGTDCTLSIRYRGEEIAGCKTTFTMEGDTEKYNVGCALR